MISAQGWLPFLGVNQRPLPHFAASSKNIGRPWAAKAKILFCKRTFRILRCKAEDSLLQPDEAVQKVQMQGAPEELRTEPGRAPQMGA